MAELEAMIKAPGKGKMIAGGMQSFLKKLILVSTARV
jgi:hypothetical protein